MAAHDAARPLLLGPTRRLTPLAVTRSAVILGCRDTLPLTVVAADGVALPGALVLPAPAARLVAEGRLAGIGFGTAAEVGEGRLAVGPLLLRVARWWSLPRRQAPAVPCLPAMPPGLPDDAAHLAAAHDLLERRRVALAAVAAFPCDDAALSGHAERLAAALLRQDEPGAHAAARSLLGLGPGLTPTGDDLVAGVLVALQRHAPEPLAPELVEALLALAWERTAPASAALLGWAARGDAVAPLLSFVDALARAGRIEPSLDRLADVGHTSGLDLAVGALAALTVLHDRRQSPTTAGAPR